MSSIGWVDFSLNDRSRVRDVLALLKEQGTLDELGIGNVRDAYSDLLFPGLSTIQTSARYFLAVPKILLDWAALSGVRRGRKPLLEFLKYAENELAKTLKLNCDDIGQPPEGVIGHTAIEKGGVGRRPSSTYWNGLRVFEIVRTELSLSDFCKEWLSDSYEESAVDALEGADDVNRWFERFIPKIPHPRGEWRKGMTLELNSSEAKFLSKRFQSSKACVDSVAAELLRANLTEQAILFKEFHAFASWGTGQPGLSDALRFRICDAQNFSHAVEGAHIVFNQVLAKKIDHEKLLQESNDDFLEWQSRPEHTRIFHSNAHVEWLRAPVDKGVVIGDLSTKFLADWNQAICSASSLNSLAQLVSQQAERNKPGRSLLVRLPSSQSDWYGMRKLEYRWGTCRRMLGEITGGLKCST